MGSVLHEVNGNYAFNHSSTGADYAGIDGKARTSTPYGCSPPMIHLEIAFNAKSKEQLLTKIRNGEQHTTIYDYKLMTETIDQNDDFYVRGSLVPGHRDHRQCPHPVVVSEDLLIPQWHQCPSDYSEIYEEPIMPLCGRESSTASARASSASARSPPTNGATCARPITAAHNPRMASWFRTVC